MGLGTSVTEGRAKTVACAVDEIAPAGKINHDWRNPATYHPGDGAITGR